MHKRRVVPILHRYSNGAKNREDDEKGVEKERKVCYNVHKEIIMELNENYFQNGKNNAPQTIQESLVEGETIVWSGKPQRKAFILNNVLKMLPIALVWIAFDSFFIAMVAKNADMIPVPAIAFMCVFFIFHLMPVWIWIYRCATASKRHKNTEYAFTSSRIIVRKGAVAVDIKSIDYKDVAAVNLRYGLIDKAAKVGDIYITSTGKATVLEDLDDPTAVEQILQRLVTAHRSDTLFTSNAKVTYVKCKYCGAKNESSASCCSTCGAPLD